MIYAAHYNYDYEENMVSSTDLGAVMQDIKYTFEATREITHEKFSDEIDMIYSEGDWKGFTLHALDPETGTSVKIKLKAASKACISNHTMLEFSAWLTNQIAA